MKFHGNSNTIGINRLEDSLSSLHKVSFLWILLFVEASHCFIYLLGPTGVGKTKISLEIAKRYHWPVVNCDSVQVYRYLDIGSSKPSEGERSEVPHFLFDYVEPPRQLTVAGYIKDVLSCLEKEKLQQALFVGGSGFYVQALEKGLYPGPGTSEGIRKQVSEWIKTRGFDSLYIWLKERDPEWIKTVNKKDHYRLRRAVEVMKSRDKTITELKREMSRGDQSPLPRHFSLKLGLKMDKQSLHRRIEKRTDKMLKRGLIEEVTSLMEKGFAHWPPLQSVGYKEVRDFLERGGDPGELKSEIIRSTMKLVKKQMTWFKRDKGIFWFSPDQKQEMLDHIKTWFEQIKKVPP